MNKLQLSPEAQKDLLEIRQYIAEELNSPQAALSTVRKIMQKIRLLQDQAFLGAPLSSITDLDSDYRFLVSGTYMVFYRVSSNDVFIDRILYGRRDYLRILLGDKFENTRTEL